MPFTPRTSTDEERAPRAKKVSAADLKKTRIVAYHHKSADPDNPCPDQRDRICTSDPTPIHKRPLG
jgi:hypothetical protein